MDILEIMKIPYYKKGKGIHIKKKNRGKFTEYCGGEVTNECILKAKKSKNPTLRKRATFAANARKWKHLTGGMLSLIPKGLGGWISKLNPLNWFKKEDYKEPELGYINWTLQQWDNMNLRYRNHTNVKELTKQTVSNNSEDYKIYGLQTTPQKDSLWYSTTSNPELEVIVFKNSETGDYIYNNLMNGKLIEENRVKQLPSNIQELINLINNGL